MNLRVLTATVQLRDHPHESNVCVLGVFDKTDEEMIQLIGEAGQKLHGKRVSFKLEKFTLNEITTRII